MAPRIFLACCSALSWPAGSLCAEASEGRGGALNGTSGLLLSNLDL